MMSKLAKKRLLRLPGLICLIVMAISMVACGYNTATRVAPTAGVVVPVPSSNATNTITPTVAATTPPTTAQPTVAPALPEFYEDRTDPAALIKSYYNAVNRKEYQRAYSYWETPGTSGTSAPPAYPQFVQGYADTASIALTLGKPNSQGAAGSTFADVPTLIVARHTNGTNETFYGCYTVRKTNPGIDPNPASQLWRIYSASIKAAPGNANTAALLAQACNK